MNTRNKSIVITGIVLLALAGIITLISGYLLDWDFKAFFRSTTAIWIYVFLGIYVFVVLCLIVKDRIDRL